MINYTDTLYIQIDSIGFIVLEYDNIKLRVQSLNQVESSIPRVIWKYIQYVIINSEIPIDWRSNYLSKLDRLSSIVIKDTIINNIHLLPNVHTIRLNNNDLRVFPSELLLHSNLRLLDLSTNNLQVLNIRHRNATLEVLDIRDNEVMSLEGTQLLTGLTSLHADNNRMTRLDRLPENLRYINLDGNRISVINLEDNHGLRQLDISSNRLTSLEGIEKLQELRILIANNNRLTNISVVSDLISNGNLYGVQLIDNQITNIPPLSINRDVHIYLSSNQLTYDSFYTDARPSITIDVPINKFKLVLDENPIYEFPEYLIYLDAGIDIKIYSNNMLRGVQNYIRDRNINMRDLLRLKLVDTYSDIIHIVPSYNM